jgi:hypothetical protein
LSLVCGSVSRPVYTSFRHHGVRFSLRPLASPSLSRYVFRQLKDRTTRRPSERVPATASRVAVSLEVLSPLKRFAVLYAVCGISTGWWLFRNYSPYSFNAETLK